MTARRSRVVDAIPPHRAVFTPSVASDILNLHPRTLMIYESENLIRPQRTATNRRRYCEEDIQRVRAIQFLTRERGLNLAGVKYVLQLLAALRQAGLDLSRVGELQAFRELDGARN